MAKSLFPVCDRKVKLLARKSDAPDNLQTLMAKATVAAILGSDDLKALGIALSRTWHSYLHGEYHGTLPFDEVKAFYAHVDALMESRGVI